MEIITALVSLLAGLVIGQMIRLRRTLGNLWVGTTGPAGAPYLFLELDTDVHAIMHKKYAVFHVRTGDCIPHE